MNAHDSLFLFRSSYSVMTSNCPRRRQCKVIDQYNRFNPVKLTIHFSPAMGLSIVRAHTGDELSNMPILAPEIKYWGWKHRHTRKKGNLLIISCLPDSKGAFVTRCGDHTTRVRPGNFTHSLQEGFRWHTQVQQWSEPFWLEKVMFLLRGWVRLTT